MTDRASAEAAGRAIRELKGRLVESTGGRLWKRFAPLSVGAIGGAALVVAGAELGRRILRLPARRNIGWLGVLAIPVIATFLSPTPADDEPPRSDAGGEGEDGATEGDSNGSGPRPAVAERERDEGE